jgi:hypothetical protein
MCWPAMAKTSAGFRSCCAKALLLSSSQDPVDGIFIAEYERGEIGPVLFQVACNTGLRPSAVERASPDSVFDILSLRDDSLPLRQHGGSARARYPISRALSRNGSITAIVPAGADTG